MSTPSPRPPLREITPEERRRTARTFLLILFAFVAGLSVLAAALTWRGREVRLYGQAVLAEVRSGSPDAAQACGVQPRPSQVTSCLAQSSGEQAEVRLTLTDGRELTFR